MAATRNKNSTGNYNLERRDTLLQRHYETNPIYAVPTLEAFPTLGIRPTHMSRDTFTNNGNGIDIESRLFGINSTNLVQPEAPLQPSFKTLPDISFFELLPLIMPKPMVIESRQRPYPI